MSDPTQNTPLRVTLYGHDTQGLGHLRRNLCIAEALAGTGGTPRTLICSGIAEAHNFAVPDGADLLTLPALHKDSDGGYRPRSLGADTGALIELRSSILSAALTSFDPDLLIVDKVAAGVLGELEASLVALRARGRCRIVFGLRDILDDAATARREWVALGTSDTLRRFYDAVWVYGDRSVADPVRDYDLEADIAKMVTFSGYLAAGRAERPADPATRATVAAGPYALCLVGGGEDGAELARAFLAAPLPGGLRRVVVTGPLMSDDDRTDLEASVGSLPDRDVLEFVNEPSLLVRSAAVVVSMAGYNTVCELLEASVPAVLVPRTSPRREQQVRAERLEALGVARCLLPEDVTPDTLAAAVSSAMANPPPRGGIDVDGVERLPAMAAELLATNQEEPAVLAPEPIRPLTGGDRVGYVCKVYPRFSETFILTEILAHERSGAALEIFSLRPPVEGRFHELLADVRSSVTYIDDRPDKVSVLWASLRDASRTLPGFDDVLADLLDADSRDAAQALALAHEVVERGVTHLHAHFGSVATTVARLAARAAGVTYSFTAHAKDIFHDDVDSADLARKIADASAVVTVSDFNVAHLHAQFGSAANIHRVYNGLDLARFPYRSPQHRPAHVVSVGRLVDKKGFEDLIDAMSVAASARPELRCTIVGAGPLDARLRDQIRSLGLRDQVEMAGPLPQAEVRRVVSGAAVFAAPCVVGDDGNRDGLPTVLLEAMALGTPCVSTDVTGIPEVIDDEFTGLMVPQHDPDALAKALVRLVDDADLRCAVAENARARIVERFDTDRQAAQLRSIFATTTPPADAPLPADGAS